jgi:hypothetical protein
MPDSPTPLQRNDDRRKLAALFRKVLADAMAERPQRQHTVAGPDGPELAWVTYERYQMFIAVNLETQSRRIPPVPMEDVMRIERSAQGHSDYAAKFAWGCAGLAMGESR